MAFKKRSGWLKFNQLPLISGLVKPNLFLTIIIVANLSYLIREQGYNYLISY